MRRVFGWILLILIAGGGLAAIATVHWYRSTVNAPLDVPDGASITVPCGANVSLIGDRLVDAGILDTTALFRLHVQLSGAGRSLKYGEYRVAQGTSLADLVDLLASGRTIRRRLTIPEGLTSWQIMQRLDAMVAEGLLVADPAEARNECNRQALEPFAPPAEGTLAPDTYFYAKGDYIGPILDRMRARQSEILTEAWGAYQARVAADPSAALPLANPEQVLILASIIERETAVAEERRRVAGVFINRLRLGMKLQTDPTVVYAVSGGRGVMDRALTLDDLRQPLAHNTYVNPGLPPTPIAHPGEAAIVAALTPEAHDYLFFVADGTGGHAFATDFDGHRENVRRWREIQAERRAAAAVTPAGGGKQDASPGAAEND